MELKDPNSPATPRTVRPSLATPPAQERLSRGLHLKPDASWTADDAVRHLTERDPR